MMCHPPVAPGQLQVCAECHLPGQSRRWYVPHGHQEAEGVWGNHIPQ